MLKKILLLLFFFPISSFAYTTHTYTPAYIVGSSFSHQLLWTDCSAGGYNPTGVGLSSSYFQTGIDSSNVMYQETPCTPYHTTDGKPSNFNFISSSTINLYNIGMLYFWYIGEGRTSPSTGYIEAYDNDTPLHGFTDSTSSARYWTVDGHVIQAYRVSFNTQDMLNGDFFVGNYTNRAYDLGDLYRFYGLVVTNDPSLDIYDQASMINVLYPGGYPSTVGGISGDDFNFDLSTTTIFSPDFASCDVSSVTLYPLDLGTFSLFTCAKEIGIYVLFGSGLDLTPINTFRENASTSIIFFPIQQAQALKNAMTSTSSTGIELTILNATTTFFSSSSIINEIKLPEELDNTISNMEYFAFYLTWAIIYIVILFT